jgi:hypothetical protein
MVAALLLAAATAAAQAPPASRGVPQTVAELAEVCAIPPGAPEHVAASFFCRGFLAGVAQYHGAMHPEGRGRTPIFCVPTPPPTLGEAVSGFVAWARANPQHGAEAAVDGLMRYAAATWPCPAGTTGRRRAS